MLLYPGRYFPVEEFSASIGVSVFFGGDSDAAAILREADAAMYRCETHRNEMHRGEPHRSG